MNSHLLPLFVSYRSSGEKLITYQANSSCVSNSHNHSVLQSIDITRRNLMLITLRAQRVNTKRVDQKNDMLRIDTYNLRLSRKSQVLSLPAWQYNVTNLTKWLQSEIIITWHWPQSVSTYSCAKRREDEDHYTLLQYSAYGTSWQSDVLTL